MYVNAYAAAKVAMDAPSEPNTPTTDTAGLRRFLYFVAKR